MPADTRRRAYRVARPDGAGDGIARQAATAIIASTRTAGRRTGEAAPFQIVALRLRGAFDKLDDAFGRLFGWAETAGLMEGIDALIYVP